MDIPLIKSIHEAEERFTVFMRSANDEDTITKGVSYAEAIQAAEDTVKRIVLNHPGEEAVVRQVDDNNWTIGLPTSDWTTRIAIEPSGG